MDELRRALVMPEARRQLQIGEVFGKIRTCGDEGASEGGGQGFREAAEVHDAVEPVQGRKSRGRNRLEVAEDVILEDVHVVRLCQPEETMRRRGIEAEAGRIVQGRIGQVEPRPVLSGEGRKASRSGPAGVQGMPIARTRCAWSTERKLK